MRSFPGCMQTSGSLATLDLSNLYIRLVRLLKCLCRPMEWLRVVAAVLTIGLLWLSGQIAPGLAVRRVDGPGSQGEGCGPLGGAGVEGDETTHRPGLHRLSLGEAVERGLLRGHAAEVIGRQLRVRRCQSLYLRTRRALSGGHWRLEPPVGGQAR
jgi:hypothetical protein